MTHKIIYDSILTGHHSEYISHLIDFIVVQETKEKFIFVVPKDFGNRFPDILSKTTSNHNITWEFIPTEKIKQLESVSLIKRSFLEYNLVKSYATKLSAVEVYLMYFNIFQIALIFKRPNFNIRGILFLQFLRMQKNTLKDKIKYYRKYITTKLYSRNKKIKSVFILNDDFTVQTLNKELNTTIFKMLPDPIPVYEEEKEFDSYEYYNIPRHKKILLHPGAIDPRKGTYEIIESIDFMISEDRDKYAFLIVGKAKPNIEQEITKKIDSLKTSNFTLVFDNTFVSNERLKSLFMQSDSVLMPYKNPEASSGILGHSILAGKSVIAPKNGLLGELVLENGFGLVIEDITPEKIASNITRLKSFKFNFNKSNVFVNKHSSNFFSTILLN